MLPDRVFLKTSLDWYQSSDIVSQLIVIQLKRNEKLSKLFQEKDHTRINAGIYMSCV